jgi:hypothetical protein
MKRTSRILSIFIIIITIISCKQSTDHDDISDNNNEESSYFRKNGEYIEYFADEYKFNLNLFETYKNSFLISGDTSIRVRTKLISNTSNGIYGIEYGDDYSSIRFTIKDGKYSIYQKTNTGGGIGYVQDVSSLALYDGLNIFNELRIDYASNTNSWKFYINGTLVKSITINDTILGSIYYIAFMGNYASVETPFNVQFRTVMPQYFP